MDKLMKYVKGNKRKVVFYVLFLCIFVLTSVILYNRDVTKAMQQPRSVMSVRQNATWIHSVGEIVVEKDVRIEQKITMVSSEFTGFALTFQKKEDQKNGIVVVQLLDSKGQTIESWKVHNSEMEEVVKHCFYIPSRSVEVGEVFTVLVTSASGESGIAVEAINLKNIKGVNELLQEVKITGGEESELERQSLSYDIFDGACGSLKYFYILILAVVLLYIFLVAVLNTTNIRKEWIFVLCVLVVGSLYNLVIPPFTVPDEDAHFVTAYAESSMIMGKTAFDEDGNVLLQSEAGQYLVRNESLDKSRYTSLIRNLLGKDKKVILEETSARKPLTLKHFGYAPQVLGTVVGRMLGLYGDQLLCLGRMFALLWYCVVMFWSIRLIPGFGKNVLSIVGMMPMTMQLVVSYSYDSVLIGACCFIISYFLYLAYDEKKTVITVKDVLLLLVAIAIITPIKFVYLPLLGLGILIPKEKFGGMKQKAFVAFVLIGGAVFSLLLTRIGAIVSAVNPVPTADNYIEKYTLMTFIKEPVKTFVTIFLTMGDKLTFYYESMIGNYFGWLEIPVPGILLHGFTVLLFLSIILQEKEKHPWTDKTRVWLILLSGSVVLILMGVFLLDMTSIHSEVVQGIQGRYFIPILPLLLLALQNKRICVKTRMDQISNSVLCVLHTAVIMSIMSVIMKR